MLKLESLLDGRCHTGIGIALMYLPNVPSISSLGGFDLIGNRHQGSKFKDQIPKALGTIRGVIRHLLVSVESRYGILRICTRQGEID